MNNRQIFFLGLGLAGIAALLILPPWRGKVYCPYRQLTFMSGPYNYENWYKKMLWEGAGKREWLGFNYRFTKHIETKTPLALEYEKAVEGAWNVNKAKLEGQTERAFFPREEFPEMYRQIEPYKDNPLCQRQKLTGINNTFLALFCVLVAMVTAGFIYTSRTRVRITHMQ